MASSNILTVPTPRRQRSWLATGSHRVCLPLVDPGTGELHRVGAVSMGCRGVLALCSGADWEALDGEAAPSLLGLTVTPMSSASPAAAGQPGTRPTAPACELTLEEGWVPAFTTHVEGFTLSWRVFAPPAEQGFIIDATLANPGPATRQATLTLGGRWAATELSLFKARPIPCVNTLLHDPWTDALVLEATQAGNLLALGLGCSERLDRILGRCPSGGEGDEPRQCGGEGGGVSGGDGVSGVSGKGVSGKGVSGKGVSGGGSVSGVSGKGGSGGGDGDGGWQDLRPGRALAQPNDGRHPLDFRLETDLLLGPGAEARVVFYAAVNLERDGARTGTVHLRRRGADALWTETLEHLRSLGPPRSVRGAAGEPELDDVLRRHLLFNHFYAVGRALDTGEAVPVTSLSPRYYVSGATWERDTLQWSFPALLFSDAALAREVLLAMFRRHFRNAGEHAHYLDGNVLYPGFELDELALYPIAVGWYLEATGDRTLLAEPEVARGLESWPARLHARRHPRHALYSTMLLSSDDPSPHPWVTYDNALAWKALKVLAGLADERGEAARAAQLEEQAEELRAAVFAHLVDPATGLLAWSTDLAGEFRMYDEPSGSLLLLPFFGFCSPDDARWAGAARWIVSDANPHWRGRCSFPGLACLHYPDHPGGLGLAACLLSGLPEAEAAALHVLRYAPLDRGLVPESFDPQTGEARTGCAFATAAGYLAWALHRYRHREGEGR